MTNADIVLIDGGIGLGNPAGSGLPFPTCLRNGA